MARKEDLRFVRTNRKLYETFYELIESALIEDLSITDICDAAKINRATFYKHFNDKKEFVFYCIAQKVKELRLERSGRETANMDTLHEDAIREIYAFLRFMAALNAKNLDHSNNTIRLVYDGLMVFYFREFVVYYTKKLHYKGDDSSVMAAYRVGSLLSIAFYGLMQGENHIDEQFAEKIVGSLVSKMKDFENKN